jgi:hypothetical protein
MYFCLVPSFAFFLRSSPVQQCINTIRLIQVSMRDIDYCTWRFFPSFFIYPLTHHDPRAVLRAALPIKWNSLKGEEMEKVKRGMKESLSCSKIEALCLPAQTLLVGRFEMTSTYAHWFFLLDKLQRFSYINWLPVECIPATTSRFSFPQTLHM